jgi:Tfp pilus assembly protein PilO
MPDIKQKKIKETLGKFYQQPVARVSLEFFLSLLAIVFFTIFAIRPTILTIADLIKEIEDKQEIEQQLQRKIAALASAQEEYQLLQDKIQLLDQAIPSKPELVRTLKVIEKIATENKVIVSNLRATAIPEEEDVSVASADQLTRIDLYISLQAVGDYPSLRDFVEALHQYRRAIVVEEVSFQIDDRVFQRTLRANMSIRIPYFGDKK